MAKITIIRDDGVIGVDGEFRHVSTAALPAGVRAVQWLHTVGHIEYDNAPNTVLTDITPFQSYVDAWTALTPVPPPPPTPAALKAEANAPILAALLAADLKIIRALVEGDTARVAAHRTAQAALRAGLQQ